VAANASLQSEYVPVHCKRSSWWHSAFVPRTSPVTSSGLGTPFSAATALLVEPLSKRRKGDGGKVVTEDDEDNNNEEQLLRTYKITMLPNPDQRRELKLIFDVARIAYNYANQRVKERIAAGMSPLQAANFQTIRNEWNNGVRDSHPCTKGVCNKHACGAIKQLMDTYKSNEAMRRKKYAHNYTINDRNLSLSDTETIVIECDSKNADSKKKNSPLSRFEHSPFGTRRKPECLAFLGGNLKSTGGIRLRDSRRVIDRLLTDGKRLKFTSFMQWDKRISAFYFLYVFEIQRLGDPDPLFSTKRVVATDPGISPFQHWYSPTSGQHGALCTSGPNDGDCGKELSRRLRCIRDRERNLNQRKMVPDPTVKSRKRCQRNRRLMRKLARERVRMHNWMRCAHYDAAKFLLERHDLIIQPWLKVQRLIRQDGLCKAGKRKLTGWSHHKFRERLTSAAARYPGRHVIVSEEPGTSGTCTHCGTWKVGLALNDKVYECQHCGILVDRQLAGARNNFLAAYGCARRVGWDGHDKR
jgi:transposase